MLGDPDKIDPIIVTNTNRFLMLQNGTVDMMSLQNTLTMGRDIRETSSLDGFAFSTPLVYTGLAFGGYPAFVDCADNLDDFNGDCRNLKICTGSHFSAHQAVIQDIFPGPRIVPFDSSSQAVELLKNKSCNVIATEAIGLNDKVMKNLLGYTGPYKVGAKLFSKDPLALMTRDGDPEWSNLVNLVVNVLITAWATGITGSTVTAENSTAGLSADFRSVIVAIVSFLGNYGELFAAHDFGYHVKE